MSIIACGIRPHAGQAWHSLCRDSKVGAGADQDVFEAADEVDRAQRFAFAVGSGEATEIEDRVADDLAGAVEGDVAAAIAFEKLDAALGKEFGRGDDVRGFGVTAKRDDRLVLKQEENVADFFFFAQGNELPLELEAGGVVDGAELDDGDQIRFATEAERKGQRAWTGTST